MDDFSFVARMLFPHNAVNLNILKQKTDLRNVKNLVVKDWRLLIPITIQLMFMHQIRMRFLWERFRTLVEMTL